MRTIEFTLTAVADMYKFKSGNQNLVFKILDLISDIEKTPFEGLGKPEPLKGNLQGYWSRCINDEHRLVYKVTDTSIEIYKCFGHYQ